MNKDFNNIELIDNFLTGRISVKEQKIFEQEMLKDPLLKQEVELQNDIITSLKEARKAQLKQRLQKIEVPSPVTGSFTVFKIAASLILATTIGAGIYFFIQDKKHEEIRISAEITKPAPTVNAIEEEIVYAGKEELELPVSKEPITASENKKIVSGPKVNRNENESTVQVVRPSEIIAPEMEENFEVIQSPDGNIQLPDGNIAQNADLKSKGLEIDINSKTENKFHYQYFNNKLFLYGSFDSEPYELLELNSAKTKQLFLYFDSKYYELKEGRSKVTPLYEIKNQDLVKQLSALRNK